MLVHRGMPVVHHAFAAPARKLADTFQNLRQRIAAAILPAFTKAMTPSAGLTAGAPRVMHTVPAGRGGHGAQPAIVIGGGNHHHRPAVVVAAPRPSFWHPRPTVVVTQRPNAGGAFLAGAALGTGAGVALSSRSQIAAGIASTIIVAIIITAIVLAILL